MSYPSSVPEQQPARDHAPSGQPGQAPRPVNAKAIIALCTAFCFPILAVVFGVKARREIDRTGEDGRLYANWGLGLGIAWCVVIALYLLAFIAFAIAGFAGLGAMSNAGF